MSRLATSLRDYLEATGESQRAFAARSGVLRQTLARIMQGGGCNAGTLARLRLATQGAVDLTDVEAELPPQAAGEGSGD